MAEKPDLRTLFEAIAEHGDTYDHVRKQRHKLGNLAAHIAISVPPLASVLWYGATNTGTSSSNLTGALLLSTIVANVGLERLNSKRKRQSVKRYEAEQQSFREYFGERIDIVARRTKHDALPLAVFWHNSKDFSDEMKPEIARQKLETMAAHMDAIKAPSLVMYADGLQAITGADPRKPGEEPVTDQEWFESVKRSGWATLTVKPETVVELSTDELREYAAMIESGRESRAHQLYINALRLSNRSRIPDLYDAQVPHADKLAAIKTALRHEIEMADHDASRVRFIDPATGLRTHHKLKTGRWSRVSSEQLHRMEHIDASDETDFSTEPLLGATGVRDAKELQGALERMIENGYVNDQGAQLARIGLWLDLQQTGPEHARKNAVRGETPYQIAAKNIAKHIIGAMDPTDVIRGVAKFVAICTLGVAAIAGTKAAGDDIEQREQSLRQSYEASSLSYQNTHSFNDYLLDTNTWDGVAIRLSHLHNAPYDALTSEPGNGVVGPKSPGALPNGISGGIGDTEKRDNDQPLANVEGLNGASLGGYWTQAVHESIGPNYPEDIHSLETSDTFTGSVYRILPSYPEDDTTPLIKVSFTPTHGVDQNPGQYEEGALLKQGFTKIVAGRVQYDYGSSMTYGRLNVLESYDGTATLVNSVPKPNVGAGMLKLTMEYWLSPGDGGAVPHAAHNLVINRLGTDLPIGEETRKALGSPTTDQEIINRIRSKTYSLTPFKDQGADNRLEWREGQLQAQGIHSIDEYGKRLGELASANCNVATTQLLIATGGEINGQEINPAVGFFNNGDNTLKSGEAHMWAVNERGDIIDTTPSTFAQARGRQELPVSPNVILGGLGTLGVLAGAAGLGLAGKRAAKPLQRSMQRGAQQAARLRAKQINKSVTSKGQKFTEPIQKLSNAIYAHPDDQRLQAINTSEAESLANLPPISKKEAVKAVEQKFGRQGFRAKRLLAKLAFSTRHRN